MKPCCFLSLLFILSSFLSSAQQRELDSLVLLLQEHPKQDERYLKILNALSLLQANIKPEDGIAGADKAIALSEKLNNQKELAAAYNNKGFILVRKSSYDEAKKLFQKSLTINTAIKNLDGIADNDCNLGEIERRQGENEKAKMLFEKTLELYSQTQNKNGIADANYFLGLTNRFTDDKKAAFLNDKAIKLYTETKNESGLAYAWNALGSYYYRISDYKNALEWLNKAKQLNELNGNLYGLSLDYGNLSTSYFALADYSKQLDCLLKALRIHKKLGSPFLEAYCYTQIGSCYLLLNQYDKAIEYSEKAIQICERLGMKGSMLVQSNNQIGSAYLKLNNPEKAFLYFNKAFAAAAENSKSDLSECYSKLGNAYFTINKNFEAIINFQKAIVLDKGMEGKTGYAEDLVGLGKVISKSTNDVLIKSGINPQQRDAKAIECYSLALQIVKGTGELNIERDALKELSAAYDKAGNQNKSFENYKQYVIYKDSIMNTENSNSIANLQIQYETEKNEQEISLLKSQQEIERLNASRRLGINFGLGGALLGIMFVAFAFYKQNKKTKRINADLEVAYSALKDAQQQLVKSEKMAAFGVMASRVAHEIQNPLNFVNNFSELSADLLQDIVSSGNEEERKETAKSLLENLEKINHHGKRAGSIVKQLQEHTRAGTAHEYFESDQP